MRKYCLRMAVFVAVSLVGIQSALGSPAIDPAVQVVAPYELDETAQGQSVQIGVNYWDPGYTGTITARVEVAEGSAYDPGTFKLDSAYASRLPGEDNVYYVQLRDCAPVNIAIESMDGTFNSSWRGFDVTVSIINSNVNYAKWRSYIYVYNVAPVCVVPPENDDSPWKVAIGGAAPTSIHWQVVSDAKGDFDGTSSFPGIEVSFMGCMNSESFYVTEPSGGTFTPDFGTVMGRQCVTMMIEDKDGGLWSWNYLYEIGYPEETINGTTWIYRILDGHAAVLEVEDCSESEILIPSSLGGYPVTSIEGGAFSECSSLTNVMIGSDVAYIAHGAFYGCDRLTSFAVDSGNAYYEVVSGLLLSKRDRTLVMVPCGLASVTIPDSVRSIGESAFYGCDNLTNVVVGVGVTNIGYQAFSGCSSLANVTLGSSVTSIEGEAFRGCSGLLDVTIPDSVTNIGYSAFEYCENLTNVIIGSAVTSIEPEAFHYCSGLASVTLSDSVTSIGYSAFGGCSGLLDVTIPDNVTSIGSYAFSGCKLVSVSIPNSVTNIGFGAFACSSLTEITVPQYVCSVRAEEIFGNWHAITNLVISEGVTSIEDYSFSERWRTLTSVTIPNSVTVIGLSAFSGCSGLTSVTIPDSVTSIGDWAFDGCRGLASVTIPDHVTSIGEGTFEDCSGLTSVTIPKSVTSIGSLAFYNCRGLASVTIPDSVTSIGSGAFDRCDNLTNVTFMGNAPSVEWYPFPDNDNCFASVSPKSTGWNVEVGGQWNGLTLRYWPEVLGVAANDAEVVDIMATFADGRIAAEIATVSKYESFRNWVNDKNLYQPNVVASPYAAAAYILGAERLFANEPKVELNELAIGGGDVVNMSVSLTVKDGDNAVIVDAAKVALMFEATSDLGDWSGAARLTPTVTVSDADASGKMTFVVTPGDGTANSAFLRIRR